MLSSLFFNAILQYPAYFFHLCLSYQGERHNAGVDPVLVFTSGNAEAARRPNEPISLIIS